MHFYPKKTIVSHLTSKQILCLFETSAQFTCIIENAKFTIRERVYMSSDVLFPIITGVVTDSDDGTTVDISFNLSKIDIVGYGICLSIVFFLSLLLGFLWSDIMLTMTLICFGFVSCAIILMFYSINCRRAFKKIIRLLESAN